MTNRWCDGHLVTRVQSSKMSTSPAKMVKSSKQTLSSVLLIFIIIIAKIFASSAQEDDVILDFKVDHTNYVDPFDMLNYDRRNLHQEKPAVDPGDQSHFPATENPMDSIEIREEVATVKSSEVTQEDEEKKPSQEVASAEKERPFLGRFVRILSNTLQLEKRQLGDEDTLHIPLSAVLTKRTQFILQEVLKDGDQIQLKKLADLDEVLSNLLVLDNERSGQPSLPFWEMLRIDNFSIKDYLPFFFLVCVCTVLVWVYRGYSLPFIISRSMVLFFVLSWLWHYIHMTQISSAKKQSDLVKNSEMPAYCYPDQVGWKDWFQHTVMRYPDPCEAYHRAWLTDPAHEVTPLAAMVDMLVVAVFKPLGFIGEQVGLFFNNILASSDWLNKIPVLVAVLFILVVVMIMSFRYEIVIPFFKIRPSVAPALPAEAPPPAITLNSFGSKVQSIEPGSQRSSIQEAPQDSVVTPAIDVDQNRSKIHRTVQEIEAPHCSPPALLEASTQTGLSDLEDNLQIEADFQML